MTDAQEAQKAPATKGKKETEIATVKLTDGRVVDFAGKRKLLKESSVVDGKVNVRLDFRNGETRTFIIPDNLTARFAAHGAEQKLGDEIAGLEDTDDAVLAIDALIKRLNEGQWSVARESNGLAGTSVLVQALVKAYGKTVEQIKAFLDGKTAAEKNALRASPKIKPFVDEIEAAKNAKAAKVDTDALLKDLEG